MANNENQRKQKSQARNCQYYRPQRYKLFSSQNDCEALGNIYIIIGTKLYRPNADIPMRTNCAPLVAVSFLFCYARDFMKSLSGDRQAERIEAVNRCPKYMDNLFSIDNSYFEGMVNEIRVYPLDWLCFKCRSPLFGYLFLPIGFFSFKIYDKRDEFDNFGW